MNNPNQVLSAHVEAKSLNTATSSLPSPPLTPTEFGKRYGRSASFAYRMIYQGRVKVLPGMRFAIPVAEVLRFESQVVIYNGRKPSRERRRASRREKNRASNVVGTEEC